MLTFGQALKVLRGKRYRTVVASAALGPKSSKADVRDFAAYLGLLEKDAIPNVGLGKLRCVAKGHGFSRLSQLFERIEAIQSGTAGAQTGVEVSADAPAPVASSTTIDTRDINGYVRGLVDGILDQSHRAERERKAAAGARKKPKRR